MGGLCTPFLRYLINYIDRQILSLLKPILDDQLHWTNAEFGMVNSAFQGAYGISLLVFGWLIDKYGTKNRLLHFDRGVELGRHGACAGG